ncbi:MAG: alpha-L-arabinofuranosidase [Opitutaceae bacterium]|nr:alpha-L-arabinofuranosidase [Opitutaceae bacterium]
MSPRISHVLAFACSLSCLAAVPLVAAPTPTVTVDTAAAGAPISPQMFGVFFEDINFGGDGGISAELVKNGSFEFADPITGWRKVERPGAAGSFGFASAEAPFPRNPRYARLTVSAVGEGFGLRNDGYRGMGVTQGARYAFSAMARVVAGEAQTLHVELLGAKDVVLASAEVPVSARTWTRISADLLANATEPKATLRVQLSAPGTLDLEAVSLMPHDTWKGRRNGLRADLVQLLADLKPGFIRFPGGCIVEGRTLENRYQWKNTVGPVENRPVIYNRWNVEFADRGKGAYDYYQSFRLGFFEYFQVCADLGAAPVPIINCGMACQFNSGELVPLAELDPYVQDALDLIEFANGSVSSTWGRVRAEMGHPEPFGLKFLGIGNEQWGPQYFERYAVFAKAIRARYPEIQLITSAGPFPEDPKFQLAWSEIPKLPVDIVDEHSYAPPEWFLNNSQRYDRQDRKGPKIFVGEYAAHVPTRRNNWTSALAEAAFITGLERNADVVVMSAYAPLLAHMDAWQWNPNLIWFDNLRSAGTANYAVQRLFSLHRGDIALPIKVEGAPVAENGQPRLYASAAWDKSARELILKLVNATAGPQEVSLALAGTSGPIRGGRAIVLAAALDAENTLDQPAGVAPVEEALEPVGAGARRTVPAHSVTVLRLPVAR